MKIVVFILFILILPFNVEGQLAFDWRPGIRESSLGEAGLHLSKRWCSWYNPALLGTPRAHQTTVALFSRQDYIGTGISKHGVSFSRTWDLQGIGGGLIGENLPGIQRWNIHIAYGKKLTDHWFSGIRLDQERFSIPTENLNSSLIRWSLFQTYSWSSGLVASLKVGLRHTTDELYSSSSDLTISWGINWQVNPKNQVQIEYGREAGFRNRWSVGLDHFLATRSHLLIGVSGMPLQLGFGWEWEWNNYQISIGASWSPELPVGSGLEWSYVD